MRFERYQGRTITAPTLLGKPDKCWALFVAGAALSPGVAVSLDPTNEGGTFDQPRGTRVITTVAANAVANALVRGVYEGKADDGGSGAPDTTYAYAASTTTVFPAQAARADDCVLVVVSGPCFARTDNQGGTIAVGDVLAPTFTVNGVLKKAATPVDLLLGASPRFVAIEVGLASATVRASQVLVTCM
jgi:hypothetical protein